LRNYRRQRCEQKAVMLARRAFFSCNGHKINVL
jgi:hypothetical protein